MPAPLPPHESEALLVHTANDRFKAQATARGAWAFSVAVGAHVALFVLAPAMDTDTGPGWLDSPTERPEVEVVALGDLASPSEGPGLHILLDRIHDGEGSDEERVEHPDGDQDGAGEDAVQSAGGRAESEGDGSGYGEGSGEGESDGVHRRLRAEAPEPDVVEPEAEEEPDLEEDEDGGAGEDAREEGDDDEGSVDIAGDPATLDEDDLPDADELDLDRLAGESPEIAMQAPSHWILVDNPDDVLDFMDEAHEAGRLQDGAEGGVLVTLWIDEVGSVEWAEIAQSSGDEGMDQVAVDLFEDVISFRPARDQGVRVPVSVRFWIHFPWRE